MWLQGELCSTSAEVLHDMPRQRFRLQRPPAIADREKKESWCTYWEGVQLLRRAMCLRICIEVCSSNLQHRQLTEDRSGHCGFRLFGLKIPSSIADALWKHITPIVQHDFAQPLVTVLGREEQEEGALESQAWTTQFIQPDPPLGIAQYQRLVVPIAPRSHPDRPIMTP